MGPIAVANVVLFPLDPLVGGLLGNIGLEGEIQQGFAISSTLTVGNSTNTYNNVVHDYAGGGRYRFTFGSASDFYVSVTGGEDAFTFAGRSALEPAPAPRHHLPLRSPRPRSPPGSRRRAGRLGGRRISRRPQQRRRAVPAVLPPRHRGRRRRRAGGALRRLVDVRGAGRRSSGAATGSPCTRSPATPTPAGGAVDQSFAFTAAHRHAHRRQQRPQGRRGRRGGTAAAQPQVPRAQVVRRRVRRRQQLGRDGFGRWPQERRRHRLRRRRPASAGGAVARPRAP